MITSANETTIRLVRWSIRLPDQHSFLLLLGSRRTRISPGLHRQKTPVRFAAELSDGEEAETLEPAAQKVNDCPAYELN